MGYMGPPPGVLSRIRMSASLTCRMPLMMVESVSRLLLTGYATGNEALGLMRTRRALLTTGGGLKTKSVALKIKAQFPKVCDKE